MHLGQWGLSRETTSLLDLRYNNFPFAKKKRRRKMYIFFLWSWTSYSKILKIYLSPASLHSNVFASRILKLNLEVIYKGDERKWKMTLNQGLACYKNSFLGLILKKNCLRACTFFIRITQIRPEPFDQIFLNGS